MSLSSSAKKVIGVIIGKGGVGKSLTTAMLASNMQAGGMHAAVMDADITGPSILAWIVRIVGKTLGNEEGNMPVHSAGGVDVSSRS